MSRLRPFGAGGSTHEDGQSLAFVIGWLESLIQDEEGNLSSISRGPKAERYRKVCDALDMLNEADDS